MHPQQRFLGSFCYLGRLVVSVGQLENLWKRRLADRRRQALPFKGANGEPLGLINHVRHRRAIYGRVRLRSNKHNEEGGENDGAKSRWEFPRITMKS